MCVRWCVCVCVCVCVLEDREDICEVLCSTKKFELPTISASLLCSSCFSASSIFLFSSGEKYFSTVISLSCGITQSTEAYQDHAAASVCSY